MEEDLFNFSGGADSGPPTSRPKRRDRASRAKPIADVSMQNGDTSGTAILIDSSDEEGANDDDDEINGNGAGPSSGRRPRKKARKFEPAPVVVDGLQIQASRELAVSAGLNAAPEGESGGSLTLTHNVRLPSFAELFIREC